MKTRKLLHTQSGFSLVELLVVIAVIAIIAAIAIPNIAGITGASRVAKDQRNAQNIASAYNAARAAGWNVVHDSKTEAISAIVAGVTGNGTNGIPTGMTFGVQNLSSSEQTSAAAYLSLTNNGTANATLTYNASGGQ